MRQPPATLKTFRHLRLTLGMLLATLPAFAQYYSNDITPPTSKSAKLNSASGGKQVGGGSDGHAVLMNGNAMSYTDLHPIYFSNSMATSNDDTQQCGYGYSPFTSGTHALLWTGTSTGYVDLHALLSFSYCLGVHGGQQVGYGERPVYFTTYQEAILWTGSGASAVSLHPVGFGYSKALGVHSGQQVGYGSSSPFPYGDTIYYQTGTHALLWTGSAASVVDLHPAGYDGSQALATNGTQQGGWGYIALGSSHLHAMLWSGTAASAVDLHPAAYTDSRITAMTATQQVGDGWTGIPGAAGSVRHALVWSGTPESVIDLNQYLPTGYTHAVATGVDASGNVVGFAYNTLSQGTAISPDAIAVVFAPGQGSASALTSLTLNQTNVAPSTPLTASITLAGPAPAAGVTLTFLSTNTNVIATPTPVTIPAGQSGATLQLSAGGTALIAPASSKLYVTDGVVSRLVNLTVTPVVNVSAISVNPIEGGFATSGTLTLTIPAQAGGAVVTLTNGNPAMAVLPASVTIPQGYTSAGFSATTSSVTTATVIPVSATFNGMTVSTTLTLSPAPVVSVSAVTFVVPSVVGGQTMGGTVTVTNFPRNASGATITLTSSDVNTLTVPATISIPQGALSASFTATTVAVSGTKGVSVKAVYNSSNATSTIQVVPIPTVSITQADYLIDLQMFKVQATTSYPNSILTFGTDPNSPAIGTMQFELGVFKGATIMATAPAFATVWNSNGGQSTIAVTQKYSSAAGGGGGGSASSFKLTVSRSGKGSVTSSPAAIACGVGSGGCSSSFASGTAVTLTAAPSAGSAWTGWSGACSGTSLTCTVTMLADKSVTASFR